MRHLRLGMVGGGPGAFIGGVHRMAARLDGHFTLVACALSPDPARAAAGAAALGIAPDRAHADFGAMARAEAARPDGIDVVAITAPNDVHYPAARAFLEAGIHVICDKPLCRDMREALALEAVVVASGRAFVLTHNYTGYPMVRHAREMVAAGELGRIRLVHVEYAQDWLTNALERTGQEQAGQKQAAWRTDPVRTGGGGCLGDIATHAFNLAEFVSGLRVESLAAELTTFVEGRRLDDNVQAMLRFEGAARGALWSSQVAPGHENALRLRISGEAASLDWRQEHPNHLHVGRLGQPASMITRGGAGAGLAAAHATRIPAGHPEGYLEGFAQLYADAAALIRGWNTGDTGPGAHLLPGIAEGIRGMRFINAALRSSGADGAWVSLEN